MKTFQGILALTLYVIGIAQCRNIDANAKDPTATQAANQIYGSEPYQLQFQEPPSNPGNNYNNYYPHNHNNYNPVTHTQSPQIQRKRLQHQDTPLDYDPFYFSARNGLQNSGTTRTRRNSKFRDFDSIASNHLFNEDVHFFRREPIGLPESSTLRLDHHKDNLQRLPVYESNINPSYFPASRSSFPRPGTGFDTFHSSSSASRPMTYDSRSRYPPYSNHIDVYDPPRHQPIFPKLFVPDRERYAREPIEGWSVQVGTQLQVHDDGRERNTGRFYVRDEKPSNVRRYPLPHSLH